MSIHQRNEPANFSYRLVIIHNGRYASELDLIQHLSPLEGDPPNFKIFEYMNYPDYRSIHTIKFCTEWNELALTMLPRRRGEYRELTWGDFTTFHRGLQYMLLYYYISPTRNYPRPGPDVPWYDELKHDSMEFLITQYGQSMDTQMLVMKNKLQEDGTQRLEQQVIHSVILQ